MKLEALVRVSLLSCLIHLPPLRRHGPFQLVSEPVGSIWTFGFIAVEPTLFRVVGMDTSRPPQFDGTNFPYYKTSMACYLEVVDLGVWRVTHEGMKPIKNPDKPTKSEEKEIHFNARAKNCLFESFSIEDEEE